MAEWLKAVDCKSVEYNLIKGSNPFFFKIRILYVVKYVSDV